VADNFGLQIGSDDDASICTIVPHELESVVDEDDEQLAKCESEEEEKDTEGRAQLSKDPRAYKLGHASPSGGAIRNSQLFPQFTILSTKPESAMELSSAQHAATRNTISVLESKVPSLESLVIAQQQSLSIT
jgi:hypothetical protein